MNIFAQKTNKLIIFSLNIELTLEGGGRWIKKIALTRHEIIEQINKVLAASSKSYV